MELAYQKWPNLQESNPVIKGTPDMAAVGVYFLSIITLNTILWLSSPKQIRFIAPVVVSIIQVNAIKTNLVNKPNVGVCGF